MGLAWDHEKTSKPKPPRIVPVTLGRGAHVLFTGHGQQILLLEDSLEEVSKGEETQYFKWANI